jgi:hypothetical protein
VKCEEEENKKEEEDEKELESKIMKILKNLF